MVQISFAARTLQPDAADTSRITDLALVRIGGQDRLVSSTRHDGDLGLWNVNGLRPDLLDDVAYLGGVGAGRTGTITVIDHATGPLLLTGGGAGGALQLTGFTGAGEMATPVTLPGTTGALGGMHHAVAVTLGSGGTAVWGARAGEDGLFGLRLDAGAALDGTFAVNDTGAVTLGAVSDLVHLSIGPHEMIFAASATEQGIASFFVTQSGALITGAQIDTGDGLWIATPTALATAEVAGSHYLIVGAATSNSLSVIRVDVDGSLHVTDHQLDTLATRFGAVQAVETIEKDGLTYVVSGGGDDGVAVHLLLPGGQLIHQASLADTYQTDLQNVSDLALRKTGSGFDIYVSSSVETGITRLTVNTGPAGVTLSAPNAGGSLQGGTGRDVLTGGAGGDILRGGAADDILRDGAGSDTLTGGAGADLFILSFDETHDVITDFTPGEDRLDLSGWPMVRDKSQLTLESTAWGMRVTYGAETLDVYSSDGGVIDHRDLTTADLVQGARIPQVVLPGYPGPWTPPPALPASYVPASGDADWVLPVITIGDQSFRNPQTGQAQRMLKGNDRDNTLRGDDRRDSIDGAGGDDRIWGQTGSDRITGDTGDDRIYGGRGDDRLTGGTGADRLMGGRAEDSLAGGIGADQLWGGTEDDILSGGAGRDVLRGEDGNDRLYGGTDRGTLFGGTGQDLLEGGTAIDRLSGGAGQDVLRGDRGADSGWGGDGDDRLYGGQGDDRLRGEGQRDIILGGDDDDRIWGGGQQDALQGQDGKDRLFGGTGNDSLSGNAGDDWLEGGAGRDQIGGGGGADRLKGGAAADRLAGGTGNDRLTGGAGADDLYGHEGTDRIAGGADDDRIWGGGGQDWLAGGSGADRLWGEAGADTLRGEGGADRLFGGAAGDALSGQGGDDALFGGDGDDALTGGKGDDHLAGEAGDDVLTGGLGADVFVFDGGQDVVLDFVQGDDLIAVDYDLFPGRLTGGEVWLFYGSFDGTTAVLDFGADTLRFDGVSDVTTLGDSLMVV